MSHKITNSIQFSQFFDKQLRNKSFSVPYSTTYDLFLRLTQGEKQKLQYYWAKDEENKARFRSRARMWVYEFHHRLLNLSS